MFELKSHYLWYKFTRLLIVVIFGFLAIPSFLFADLEVSLVSSESSGGKSDFPGMQKPCKGIVKVRCKNTFLQPIKNARIWIFLLDDEGKVVGNKAMWLQGPQDNYNEKADNKKPLLEQDKVGEYSIIVDTQRPHTKTKITFSRIILQDGSTANPQKTVVTRKGEE